MKEKILVIIYVSLHATMVYSADVYDFGYDNRTKKMTTHIKRETGFKESKRSRSDDPESEERKEADASYKVESGKGCEETKKVGGSVVRLKNNCSKDGKPLVSFGK